MSCLGLHCSADNDLLQLSCLGHISLDVSLDAFLETPSTIQTRQAVSCSALGLGMRWSDW